MRTAFRSITLGDTHLRVCPHFFRKAPRPEETNAMQPTSPMPYRLDHTEDTVPQFLSEEDARRVLVCNYRTAGVVEPLLGAIKRGQRVHVRGGVLRQV